MNTKLIFFDIDGTLLDQYGRYSSNLKKLLSNIQKQGVKTAIASGRPSYATHFLVDELNIADPGVFCTGAELYNPRKKQHLHVENLDIEICHTLYQQVKRVGIYCEHYLSDSYIVDHMTDITHVHSEHLRVKPTVLNGEKLYTQQPQIIKLLLGRDKQSDTPSLMSIQEQFPQFDFAFAQFLARPNWEFASVVSRKANKNKAFDKMLNYYQLTPDQVMSIGDSHSDITFIERAGMGVAMGNASNDVKKVANFITKTADENGVDHALEQLIC